MRRFQVIRNRGAVFVSALLVLVFVAVLAAGLSQVSVVNLRASTESNDRMRVFYLADSGAHIGHFQVEAAAGTIADTSFTETIGGETVNVTITNVGAGLLEVSSTATLGGDPVNVKMAIEVISSFAMKGGVETHFDSGVELEGSAIPVTIGGTATISGLDHDDTGALKADQTAATMGLAMNIVPGGKDWSVTQDVGATLEGVPTPTTNSAETQSAIMTALRDYVKGNADIKISGSKTLGDAHTGSYGTALDPKLVYVKLGEEETLTMQQGFTGYGTLVINIKDAEFNPALNMLNTSKWYGPILIVFRNEAEVDGGTLINLQDDASIVGGLMLHFTGEEIELDGGGEVLSATGNSSILYSSDLVNTAPGITSVTTGTTQVVSYVVD